MPGAHAPERLSAAARRRIRKDLLTGLTRAFREAGHHPIPLPERRYHKDDEYRSYGVRTTEFWRIVRSFHPLILGLPLPDRWDLAISLLKTHVGELGHAGISVLVISRDRLRPRNFGILDRCVVDFRSWSHVDHLALDVMQHLLWNYPRQTRTLLERWSRSPLRWKRRASVVTLTRNISRSGRFTPFTLRLCRALAHDPDDLVRKGVGWALKDTIRATPGEGLQLLRELRTDGVSSTVILYALRGQSEQTRQMILRPPPSFRRAAGRRSAGTRRIEL